MLALDRLLMFRRQMADPQLVTDHSPPATLQQAVATHWSNRNQDHFLVMAT
jgi:hypothetical protein